MAIKTAATDNFKVKVPGSNELGFKWVTTDPKKNVTTAGVEFHAQHFGYKANDTITLSCMNHEEDTVYWKRQYTVGRSVLEPKTVTNESGDASYKSVPNVSIKPDGDWIKIYPEPGSLPVDEQTPVVRIDMKDSSPMEMSNNTFSDSAPDMIRVWNPTSRLHEVRRRIDQSVVCEIPAGEQETADLIVAGKLPIPVAA